MLDIRVLGQSRGPESQNPVEWQREYLRGRLAGAIADWLHNLAYYSIYDFRGFDMEEFWQRYESICQRFEQLRPGGYYDYRLRYEEELARQDARHPQHIWRQILCLIFPRKPRRF